MIGIGIANAIGFNRNDKDSIRIPTAIKNSMVLWYDIAKQKATNESMSLSPILKDLSGNGNDATCYNFGWSKMSGIGGYSMPNLTTWIKNSMVVTETITDNKIKIVSGGNAISGIGIRTSYHSDISIKFSFTELVSSISVRKIDNTGNTIIQTITEEGEYIFDVKYDADKTYNQILIAGLGTIEQLPLYPNALVSDGVNDYCLVQDRYDDEGNLINKKSLVLNKEDGYTVIAKRKWINEPTAGAFNPIASKQGSTTMAENSAFVFEYSRISNSIRQYGSWNFGSPNTLNSIADGDVVYQTSKSYNGQNVLNVGSNEDSDRLYISSLFNNTGFANIALYSLLLFNRDLTEEEIEWVKNNLIQ